MTDFTHGPTCSSDCGAVSALSCALRGWTAALGEPGTDLSDLFEALIEHLTAAVPSLVAARITIDVDGRPVTFASPAPTGARIETTLSFPLPMARSGSCVLVLAASSPGAFTRLAHDAVTELGVASEIHRDADTSAFDDVDDPGLDERSLVDVAVGILLDRGHRTPASAIAELRRRAARDDRTLADTAHAIIAAAAELAGERIDEDDDPTDDMGRPFGIPL